MSKLGNLKAENNPHPPQEKQLHGLAVEHPLRCEKNLVGRAFQTLAGLSTEPSAGISTIVSDVFTRFFCDGGETFSSRGKRPWVFYVSQKSCQTSKLIRYRTSNTPS